MLHFQVVIVLSLFSIAFAKQASVTLDTVKSDCPVFDDNVCPFARLKDDHKGLASKCPAFKGGCPFKNLKTVGDFQAKLGRMRDKCKGQAQYLEFVRSVHRIAQDKAVDEGRSCPFFDKKDGCPFAKDTSGKAIMSPDYKVTPMDVDFDDIKAKCPAFDKNTCPYMGLVSDHKGIAKGKCSSFSDGCPFKSLNTVGEFVEKLTQMRDSCKGKAAYQKFFKDVHTVSEAKQKKLGKCTFNEYLCPFSHDADGGKMIA